jgi:hypothetical protein
MSVAMGAGAVSVACAGVGDAGLQAVKAIASSTAATE